MLRIAVRIVVRTLLACLLWASHSASSAEAPRPKGSLVIIGGALRGDNAMVWERMVQLAGGKGARIAVFASASASPEKTGKILVERFNQYGARAFFVPVAVRLSGIDYQAAADDPAIMPPRRYMSHRASSMRVLLPSPRRSARVMRPWSPPAKKAPPAERTAAASAGSSAAAW